MAGYSTIVLSNFPNVLTLSQTNPRRLQQLLDGAGGRDLLISWMQQSMDRLSVAYLGSKTPIHSAASVNSSSSGNSQAQDSRLTPGGAGAVDRKGYFGMTPAEELEHTRLIEYCVTLVNQVGGL